MPKAPNTEAARKAPKATSQESEARVSEICDIMSAGQWVTHITSSQLATKWGVSVNTVDKLAGEASRRIRYIVSKAPELRARMVANLEVIVSMALTKNRSRDAIEAIKAMAGIVDSDERSTLDREAKAEALKGGGGEGTEITIITRGAPATVSVSQGKPKPE